MSLTLPDGRLTGACRLPGGRVPDNHPLPAYATFWAAGRLPTAFLTFTYYGHYRQSWVGRWSATGSNPLLTALARA